MRKIILIYSFLIFVLSSNIFAVTYYDLKAKNIIASGNVTANAYYGATMNFTTQSGVIVYQDGNPIMKSSIPSSSISVGKNSLNSNIGNLNSSFGLNSMNKNTTGSYNTAIGANSLFNNVSGNYNIVVGDYALADSVYGNYNTAVGSSALHNSNSAGYNTAIGRSALFTNSSGTGNVTLGHEAGYYETGSNKLFIDNQKRENESDARTKSLIYGEFDQATENQKIVVNGNLDVSGTVTINTVVLNDYVQIDEENAFYWGDKDTDGSWRTIRVGDNLENQRRESGTWVYKSKSTP